jgi:fumarate reductase flavoprotein subunit
MKSAVYAGHVGNDGTAVRWGQALGVALKDMGAYQGHGSWQNELGLLISWAIMVAGGIQINAHGLRFHDEHQGYSEASVGVLAQLGGVAWCVFDQPVYELGLTFPEFKEAQLLGGVKRFETVAALSQWVGCPKETLARTLSGEDEARDHQDGQPECQSKLARALKPPLYAIKVTGALFHTQGGLDIDEHCRVLGAQGVPLPNLWAAGGAARGVSGQEVWGYLSGNGLLSALAGGFIAAESMARALAHPSTQVD